MTVITPERFDEHFEAIYLQYFDHLVQVAVFKFKVPETDAEGLVHDVLISYIRKNEVIIELHSWFIGAICFASRHYWRLNSRAVIEADLDVSLDRVDPTSLHILDSLPDQLAGRQALERLSPRYQEILHMRYFEGLTVPEMAKLLGVKSKYAQKLIAKCLRRAEKLYSPEGRPRK
jgi:RNA polymerase sigma factor (sigma-70 family)